MMQRFESDPDMLRQTLFRMEESQTRMMRILEELKKYASAEKMEIIAAGTEDILKVLREACERGSELEDRLFSMIAQVEEGL